MEWNGYEFREARYPVDEDGDIPPVSLPEGAESITLDRMEGYVIVRYLLPDEAEADHAGAGGFVYVVMESKDSIPTEEIRRVFSTPDAADEYVRDPENAGNLHVEKERIYREWRGFE